MTLPFLLLQAAAAPGALAGHVLVHSEHHHGVLLLGGEGTDARPLYLLEGATFVPLPGSALRARSLPAVAADGQGNVLVHGGALEEAGPDGDRTFHVTGETWRWDGTSWSLLATDGPAPRDHHAMAYDARRRVFVLFGGSDAAPDGRTTLFGDTWEWAGSAWELVGEEGPSPRAHHAMAYDPRHDTTLLVGGAAGDDRTWGWDGHAWRVLRRGPPASRRSPRLAWDPRSGRVLLFGGQDAGGLPDDTWAWDGEAWAVVREHGPPGRTVHALAFDATRGALILHGGADRLRVLDDLWELSDEGWTRIRP